MAFEVLVTENAQRDLDRIIEYLVTELANLSAAKTLLDRADDCYDDLAAMPFLYAECQLPRLKALGYRKAVLGRYILIYRVCEDEGRVYVLRYFSGRQDYEKLL